MKLSIISFGTNSRIAAKFQTDQLWTFRENLAEKNKEITPSNHKRSAAAKLRSAVAGGVNNPPYWELPIWCCRPPYLHSFPTCIC